MQVNTTTRGRIVIPAALRRKYGITAGTKITIRDNGKEIILRPMTPDRISKLRGSLKGKGTFQVFLDERQEDRERSD